MYFEHLVEINDLNNPVEAVLTIEELWAGMMLRVENPVPFLPGMESCKILADGEGWAERCLNFGAAQIKDKVTWVSGKSTHFEIEPSSQHAGGSLTIQIEAHGTENALFLRFTYQTHHPAAQDDNQYTDYVKSAYQQSDLDMVRLIREWIAEGRHLRGLRH